MSDEIVAAPRRRGRTAALVSIVLLVAVVIASMLIRLPYYTEAPGAIRATEQRIAVDGHEAFNSDGEIYFTTVSQRQATPMELIHAWLDDAIDVVPQEKLFPEGNTSEVQVVNKKMMEDSKFNATVAALDDLGLPVTVTGDGAFIAQFVDGAPISKVAKQGDVITAVGDVPIMSSDELGVALKGHPVGDTVQLGIRDGSTGATRTVTTTLIANDSDASRGFLGISVETANATLKLPFTLSIDSGEVTGPSAGLAWSLGIVDRLTPGDLTDGRRVAVTGTIDPQGNVGAIGGIAQKVAAVKRDGIKVFIFPKDTSDEDLARVRETAGTAVELHQVSTLQEALAILAPNGVPAAPGASPTTTTSPTTSTTTTTTPSTVPAPTSSVPG